MIKKTEVKAPDKHRCIMIGTSDEGLFCGYVPDDGPSNYDLVGTRIELFAAWQCIYFTGRGAASMAVDGPNKECRITRRMISICPYGDVRNISDVTPEAVLAWESEPWG